MFAQKTVFIVGAGCSYEYGLPVGNGLRSQIVKALGRLVEPPRSKADEVFSEAIMRLARDHSQGIEDEWLDAAAEISRGVGHASSIDRYLNLRQDNDKIVQIGKLAIVHSIASAEADSSLVLKGGLLDFDAIYEKAHRKPDWLSNLFLQMQEGCSRESFKDAFQNLTFVCFNYDRCIEHYFFNAAKALCSFDDAETARVLKHLKIFHPYGRIGKPHWEGGPPMLRLKFGAEINDDEQLIELSKGIKTFTEKVDEGDELKAIHEAISEAESIIFAGFSFLDQNMDLLTPQRAASAKSVYATAFDESRPNQEIARGLILQLLAGRDNPAPDDIGIDIQHSTITAGSFISSHGNQLRR